MRSQNLKHTRAVGRKRCIVCVCAVVRVLYELFPECGCFVRRFPEYAAVQHSLLWLRCGSGGGRRLCLFSSREEKKTHTRPKSTRKEAHAHALTSASSGPARYTGTCSRTRIPYARKMPYAQCRGIIKMSLCGCTQHFYVAWDVFLERRAAGGPRRPVCGCERCQRIAPTVFCRVSKTTQPSALSSSVC